MRCGKKMIKIPDYFSQKDCDGGNAATAEGINHKGHKGSQREPVSSFVNLCVLCG
jgi:hypothetical protein